MRRVGIGHARELIFSGAVIGADEALRIGLANKVVPAADLLATANVMAKTIASMGPAAVSAAKHVMLTGESSTLKDATAAEATSFARCFTTADQKEGMTAFLEKRAATFSGK